MLLFRQISLNLIYFINILLIFLLVFEDKVELPVFLQVGGEVASSGFAFSARLAFCGNLSRVADFAKELSSSRYT